MDIQNQRAQFLENGYDPIPLKPKSKLPASKAWESKPTITQWNYAKGSVNIGLRAGYGRAFIDCDDKNKIGTFETVTRWLDGLGYHVGDYPIVQTPTLTEIGTHGAHIYVNFTGQMMDSKKNLKSDIGAGEFRYGTGAYVAAFPSTIDDGEYKLISGNIARLPEIDLHDVSTLINVNEEEKPKTDKKMSRLAYAIASGTRPERYQSNSEGEAGLILSLINSGYTYEEIKYIFNSFPCLGHYRQKHADQNPREGERWLYMTYQSMLTFSHHESPARRMIAKLQETAEAAAWSSANRRKLLLAHLDIAYKAGKPEYVAGIRDLALGAGVHKDTASNHTKKLINDGLIYLTEAGNVVSANRYALNSEKIGHSLRTKNVRKCPKFSNHDAFRNGGGRYAKGRLGRRAGEIYELIFNNPLPVSEIAKQTGATIKTVESALKKMNKFIDFRTGEIIEMVSCDGEIWNANLVDLDVIAAMIGTFAATGKQKLTYEKERRDHARNLEIGTLRRE